MSSLSVHRGINHHSNSQGRVREDNWYTGAKCKELATGLAGFSVSSLRVQALPVQRGRSCCWPSPGCIHTESARVSAGIPVTLSDEQILQRTPVDPGSRSHLERMLGPRVDAPPPGVHRLFSFLHCLVFAVLGKERRDSCVLRKDSARVSLPYPSDVQSVSCALLLRHCRLSRWRSALHQLDCISP